MRIAARYTLAVLLLVIVVSASLLFSLSSLSTASGTADESEPLLQFVSKQKDRSPSLENTTLMQGESAIVPIVAMPTSGYEIQAVNLEVHDVPRNVYAWIDWNSYPIFANEGSDHTYVKDYQLTIYVDSNAESGEYALNIVGTNGVAKNLATSEDIQITNETLGTLHLTITPSSSKITMDISEPDYQSKELCVEDNSSPGGGTMCVGFVGEEEFPFTISSASNTSISETIKLSASGIPDGVWAKFVPASLNLSNSGYGDQQPTVNGKLILAGAVRPFGGFPPDTIVAVIKAGDATNFLPIVRTLDMTVLYAEDKIDFPSEIIQNINGTNFGYTGVVYDPYDNSSSLPVNLTIAGMTEEEGSQAIISPLPEWIKAEIPIPSFTLNSTEPHYFLVKVTTHLAPVGTYYLAINELVGDQHFTGYLEVDVTPPVYYAPAQEQNSLSEKSIEVKVGDKSYPLYYYMSNGATINDISVDKEHLTMIINVSAPTQNKLELRFPRELYDALSFTEHGDPIAVVDGKFTEDVLGVTRYCEDTSLVVPLRSGAKGIELIFADILMNHSHTYPEKIDLFKSINTEGREFSIRLLTDAKKCDVSFAKEDKKIHIDIEGREDATNTDKGYFRITLPHALLGGNYTVLVDGKPTRFTEQQFFTKNNTDIGVESAIRDDFTPIEASHLVFDYPKDAKNIDVIGTSAIPEFGSYAMLLAILTFATIGGLLAMRRFMTFDTK